MRDHTGLGSGNVRITTGERYGPTARNPKMTGKAATRVLLVLFSARHPRGPHCTPRACHKCAPEQEVDSGLPMTDLAWYLSSASDQSDSEDGGGDAKVVKFVPRVISGEWLNRKRCAARLLRLCS